MAWTQYFDPFETDPSAAASAIHLFTRNPAIPSTRPIVYRKTHTFAYAGSATSTASFPSDHGLYVYGIKPIGFVIDAALSPLTSGDLGTPDYINYLEGQPIPRDAALRVDATDTEANPVLAPTAIREQATYGTVQTRTLDAAGAPVLVPATLDAQLQDPCVIKLPRGKRRYLMVLSRIRRDPTEDSVGPDRTLSEIVCYLSNDPTFPNTIDDVTGEADTVGPFWLVDSLVTIRKLGVLTRYWCSVPSIILGPSGDQLYLYYVAEPSEVYGAFLNPNPAYDYGDDKTWMDAHAMPRGIYCTRIPLVALQSLVSRARRNPNITDPTQWESNVTTCLVRSAFLGICRFWLASGTWDAATQTAQVTSFDFRYYNPGSGIYAYVADPAAVQRGGIYTLFFSAISLDAPGSGAGSNPTGRGLWRASFLDSGLDLVDETGRTTVSVFGRDFLSADVTSFADATMAVVLPGATGYTDLIVGSTLLLEWKDPDPRRMPDGTWRVQGGASASEFSTGTSYLGLILGTDADVLVPWVVLLEPASRVAYPTTALDPNPTPVLHWP